MEINGHKFQHKAPLSRASREALYTIKPIKMFFFLAGAAFKMKNLSPIQTPGYGMVLVGKKSLQTDLQNGKEPALYSTLSSGISFFLEAQTLVTSSNP